MLISLSHKFIFVANLKTASTAIENALHRFAQIRLRASEWRKHMTLAEVEANFAWLFSHVDRDELFIFGVMRDPVDYMLSLRNSHSNPKFRHLPNLNAHGMTFARFLAEWVPRNRNQASPQCQRFHDTSGRIGVDYLISYDKLEEVWPYVCERIGLPNRPRLRRANASPRPVRRPDLTAADLAWIEAEFAPDRIVLATMCNRPLRDEARRTGPPVRFIPHPNYATKSG